MYKQTPNNNYTNRASAAAAPARLAGGMTSLSRRPAQANAELHPEVFADRHVLSIEQFSLFYGKHKALHEISMPVAAGKVTALVGPSG